MIDPLNDVKKYVTDVVSGEIVACKSIIGACQRHLDDLDRVGDPDFPYYFDEEHASRVCKFFPVLVRHSIGKHAGKPFELQSWQAFAMASIFGWKRTTDLLDESGEVQVPKGARRYTKAYLSVARKNGKSTWAAAICHLVAAFDVNPVTKKPENIAQVVIAASKKEQAEKVTMAECVRMRGQSPVMLEKSKYQNRQITYAHNQGSICAIGSDRPFDGLNPSMVVVDELHAFRGEGKQVEFLDTMKTGSGARVQPLFLITTTAGSTSSLLWLQEYGYATRVARSEIKDDTYFSLSYELDEEDDALDPDNWIKANPCLGVTLTKKFLEDQARPAAESDDALRTFTRYHGNRVVSSTSGAFNMDHWKEATGDIVHETWRLEADCIGCGVDLGGRNDLAAWGAVARFTTGDQDDEGNPVYRYEGFARAYISDKAPRDLKAEPFPEFVESGHLRVCKNPIAELERDLLEFAKRVGAEEVAFDPYQAQRTSEFFADHGMTPVSMPQTTMHFNAPIEEIRACLAENRLIHESSDLLQWCVGNAVVDEDRQQRLMLCKRESSEKIDPAVAFTMAFSRAMNGQSKAGDFLVW